MWLLQKRSLIALASVSMVVLMTVGIVFGPDSYRKWKHERYVKRAEQAIEEDNLRLASLNLRKAQLSQPDNPGSAKLMAELASKHHSADAINWWERVCSLEPSTSNYLSWAETAIEHGDTASAVRAIEAMDGATPHDLRYHLAAAKVASATKDVPIAIHHLELALEQEPDDLDIEFQLQSTRMLSTNPAERSLAHQRMTEFAELPEFERRALRRLAADGLLTGATNDAVLWSGRLASLPEPSIEDELLCLQALHVANDPQRTSQLEQVEALADGQADAAVKVGRWFIASQQPGKALEWMRRQPPIVQTNLPGALIVVDGLTATEAWEETVSTLEHQNWEGMDAMRLAIVARGHRMQDLDFAFQREWSKALRSASSSKQQLVQLAQLAVTWKWSEETEQILWEIVSRYPEEKWAFKNLTTLLYVTGKTRSLKTLLARLAEVEPDNNKVKNNLAMTGLLLDPDDIASHQVAEACYRSDSNNIHFASTYAYSLSLQKRNEEALEVMETFGSGESVNAEVRIYLGLIKLGAGMNQEGRELLEGWERMRLLPEERALVNAALATVDTKA